jgi:hypothetical protein
MRPCAVSIQGCATGISPNVRFYIYAPNHAAVKASQPPGFRGLSSRVAVSTLLLRHRYSVLYQFCVLKHALGFLAQAAHGHLIDGEGFDMVTPSDADGYVPWFGLGVTQDAPAATWASAAAGHTAEFSGLMYHRCGAHSGYPFSEKRHISVLEQCKQSWSVMHTGGPNRLADAARAPV